jgi:hypothetical protein
MNTFQKRVDVYHIDSAIEDWERQWLGQRHRCFLTSKKKAFIRKSGKGLMQLSGSLACTRLWVPSPALERQKETVW